MFSPYGERIAPLRVIDPTGLYHVMSRGNFRATIFLDERHYSKYLELLTRVAKRRDWCVLDWCLIPNHYHLLIQLTNDGLSDGMRELNGCFSRWSNLQTSRTRTGHVLKNRFGSVEVVDEGHLFELIRYIPNNPVKANLVQGQRTGLGRGSERPPESIIRIRFTGRPSFSPTSDRLVGRRFGAIEHSSTMDDCQ
jgi:REP element-mobilizing transposase RayT